mmetsp:Transcript_117862/g.203650  ORF Transcript_117862/g.203650 Transcript_117862/m.203650 type:complete len:322 (+) Transcript_117862:60-1025(+)
MQAALLLSFLFAGRLVDSAKLFTEPPVKALDGVEQALKKITALPHLSASQQKSANGVVDFVMQSVHDVENSKGLTKEAKAKEVKEAITKLQGLQEQWTKMAGNMSAADCKVGQLQAELAEKRQELAKAEGMLKLNKLKKELLEKKLLLNKLVAEQAEAKQQKAQQSADANAKHAVVKQLAAAAQDIAVHEVAAKSSGNRSAQIVAIMAMLHAREHNITQSIKKLDAAENASESTFAKLAGKSLDASQDEGVAKARRMLQNVKKQEHRKIEKAKAAQKAELAEVTAAVSSIEKGDVKGLQTVLAKMQGEMQSLDAHTGNFIY